MKCLYSENTQGIYESSPIDGSFDFMTVWVKKTMVVQICSGKIDTDIQVFIFILKKEYHNHNHNIRWSYVFQVHWVMLLYLIL